MGHEQDGLWECLTLPPRCTLAQPPTASTLSFCLRTGFWNNFATHTAGQNDHHPPYGDNSEEYVLPPLLGWPMRTRLGSWSVWTAFPALSQISITPTVFPCITYHINYRPLSPWNATQDT